MIDKLHKSKSVVASILVLAFSGVFLCDLLCDLHIIGGNCQSECTEMDMNPKHASHNLPSNHNDTKASECCEDLTQSVYDNLIQQKLQSIDHIVKYLVYSIQLPSLEWIGGIRYFEEAILRLNLPPPDPGSAIRISLQSFLY